ncbi:MAG: hypothetical protein IPK50_08465 [Fibrobacterota bacterium]|nr:MAG: hypothetical protein IPK50_08465 [Fibrobacterota bacterium]
MKSLRLEKVTILSSKEKKGLSIEIDPKLTVLKGKNRTGKSSVIKSILHAFGASPNKISKRWKDARPKVLVEFKIDNAPFAIIRDGDTIKLYQNGDFAGSYRDTIQDWAIKFSQLLDSKLMLTNKNGELLPAKPACLFMPYYLDQETGWQEKWKSFSGMGVYPDWQRTLFDYHSGIITDSIFEARSAEITQKKVCESLFKKIETLQSAKEVVAPIKERLKHSISDERFKDDLIEVISLHEKIAIRQSKFRQRLSKLQTEYSIVVGQINILQKAQTELRKDFAFSAKENESIACPTCGTQHKNDFLVRFSILDDEENCINILDELNDKKGRLETKLLEIRNQFQETTLEKSSLLQILQQKRDNVTLEDLIKKTGQDVAIANLNKSIHEFQIKLDAAEVILQKIKSEVKSLYNKSRRKDVLMDFYANCDIAVSELNLGKINRFELIDIKKPINENGAEQPRAIFAFQIAFFRTICNSMGKALFPFVIDAPNQQEQDKGNLISILTLINDRLASKTQTILGVVDDVDVSFVGKMYLFSEADSILRVEEYEECKRIFKLYDKISHYV